MGAGREGTRPRSRDPRLHIVPALKGAVMEWKVIRQWRSTDLIACSLCLRVRRDSAWVEPEDVIAELRSYELDTPPALLPGVCDNCADAVFDRRTQTEEPVAA
jgi:hypothetical protein